MKTKLLTTKAVFIGIPSSMVAVVLLSAGLANAQDCVILKRMGPADQITSHMYSFGIRGKQFQYVEGPLPKGVKFHGRLTDNDVRKIQEAGGRFVVLEPKFTGADLAEARKGCIASFSQTPSGNPAVSNGPSSSASASNQAVQKAPDVAVTQATPSPEPTQTVASQPAVRTAGLSVQENQSGPPLNGAPVPASSEGTVSITSDIEGAEVFVDSVGRGHAPMIIKLPAGRHLIQLVLADHKDWLKEIDLKGDSIVNVSAAFQMKQ
jgi:hypothetical protein